MNDVLQPSINNAFQFISNLFLAPCKTTTYESNLLQMMQNPFDMWGNQRKVNSKSFERIISMYYTTSDIATYTENRLIDFSGFVSAIGGNLGLFLGFSFLGILFSFYECFENVLLSKYK